MMDAHSVLLMASGFVMGLVVGGLIVGVLLILAANENRLPLSATPRTRYVGRERGRVVIPD